MKKSQLKSIIRQLLHEQMSATNPGLISMPGTSDVNPQGGGIGMNMAQPGLSSMAGQDMSNQEFGGVTITQLIQQLQQEGAPSSIMRDVKAMRNFMRRGDVRGAVRKAQSLVNMSKKPMMRETSAMITEKKNFWKTIGGRLLLAFGLGLLGALGGAVGTGLGNMIFPESRKPQMQEGHCYDEDGKPMPEGHCYEEDMKEQSIGMSQGPASTMGMNSGISPQLISQVRDAARKMDMLATGLENGEPRLFKFFNKLKMRILRGIINSIIDLINSLP